MVHKKTKDVAIDLNDTGELPVMNKLQNACWMICLVGLLLVIIGSANAAYQNQNAVQNALLSQSEQNDLTVIQKSTITLSESLKLAKMGQTVAIIGAIVSLFGLIGYSRIINRRMDLIEEKNRK